MHILFDARIHIGYISGISRYIACLMRHLPREDPDVSYTVLVSRHIREEDGLLKIFKDHSNVTIKTLNIPHMGPVNRFFMYRVIRAIRPDIYHYPHLDMPISPVRSIATIHDAALFHGIRKFKDRVGLKELYLRYALKHTLRNADRLVFVTKSAREEILHRAGMRLDENRHWVIHHGLDEAFYSVGQREIEAIKNKYLLPNRYCLYVGAIREHKNLERMLEAFCSLDRRDISLVLVGERYAGYNLHLERPRVIYLGGVGDEDLKGIIKLAACLLFPSLMEGFGLPIIEAMAFGVPVITSNLGATKEVGGNLASYVDPYSVEDIRNKLGQMLDNDDKASNYAARRIERARSFSCRKVAEQHLLMYKELMQVKSHSANT